MNFNGAGSETKPKAHGVAWGIRKTAGVVNAGGEGLSWRPRLWKSLSPKTLTLTETLRGLGGGSAPGVEVDNA